MIFLASMPPRIRVRKVKISSRKSRKGRRKGSRSSSRSSKRSSGSGRRGSATTRLGAALVHAEPRIEKQLLRTQHINRKMVGSLRATGIAKIIASGICNPLSCPNLRLITSPASADVTATVQLHTYTPYKQPTQSTTAVYSATFPLGNTFLALFRDAMRAYIVFTTNPSTATYTYVAYAPNLAESALTTNIPMEPGFSAFAPVYFAATSAFTPHDQYLYTGIGFDAYHYCWMDLGSTMVFTQASAQACTMYAYLWDGNSSQYVFSVPQSFSGGSVTYTCTRMGYYNFEFQLTGTATTYGVVYSGASEAFGHHAAAGIQAHLSVLDSYRVNAASIMVTPICAEIVKNGAVSAAWLPGEADWTDFLTFGESAALSTGRNFPFATGIYAYLKPGDIPDFAYSHTVKNVGGITQTAGFDLCASSRFTVINASVDATSLTSNNVATGLEFMVTYVANLEFVTNDQWHETHLPPGKYSDFTDALGAVRVVDPFHENPLHWSDITGALKKGFNFVKRFSTPISTALSAMFPEFAPAVMAGGALVQTLPEL